MTFLELTTELLNRCGEGYQDYLAEAKAILIKVFSDMIVNGAVTEDEYFGLIANTTAIGFTTPFPVYDVIQAEGFNFVKFLSVLVDNKVIDSITNAEYTRKTELGTLLPFSYYYMNGHLNFTNVPVHPDPIPNELVIKYVKKYVEDTEDLNYKFSNSFLNKALDLAVPIVYQEINA